MEKQFGRDSYDTGRKKLQGTVIDVLREVRVYFASRYKEQMLFFTKEMRERFKE